MSQRRDGNAQHHAGGKTRSPKKVRQEISGAEEAVNKALMRLITGSQSPGVRPRSAKCESTSLSEGDGRRHVDLGPSAFSGGLRTDLVDGWNGRAIS